MISLNCSVVIIFKFKKNILSHRFQLFTSILLYMMLLVFSNFIFMKSSMKIKTLLCFLFFLVSSINSAQNKGKLKSNKFSEKSLTFSGFFDFTYNYDKDLIYLTVNELEKEFLYVNSLSSGMGNNDIGLDRGQLGNQRIVYFSKFGDKLMLIQPNLSYRSTSENTEEKKSVNEAFARSVLFGFPIVEISERGYVIDLTPFLMQDTHGVANRLSLMGEGDYELDPTRSAISLPRTKAFPKNIEFDIMLTFSGTPSGSLISSVTPTPEAITLNQHHSFVALPDSNYKPRQFDPRSGANALTFYDYTTPVSQSTKKQYLLRHRLIKKNPSATFSEPVEPIIYYLDNGTPEPVRSALIEGGMWWNQAFENIGFKNAFQIKMLPKDADPLDVRYNVIQWVHRSTRGWSYGSSVTDPRTGEIIKGHVTLGSLRIRQDFMIALGLIEQPFLEDNNKENIALEMALSRIRQLSAHEIGHTLGFAHNFTASSNLRSSVMDYPHPNITFSNGEISISEAYEKGIGEWDKISVAYSYSHFPKNINEKKALDSILNKSTLDGHRFITDKDARPIGGAHPLAHLWDNGSNPTTELIRLLDIRKKALENFSINHLRNGETYSTLEDRMVPIYLIHRYQMEAVVKLIGGVDYDYAVKGSQKYKVKVVDGTIQRNALLAFQKALSPESLTIPENFRDLLPPRSFFNPRTRENFLSDTGITFDYLGIANITSENFIKMLLHPERANRLVTQYGFDSNQLSLKETLNNLIDSHFKAEYRNKHFQQLNDIVKNNILKYIIILGLQKNANAIVKATVFNQLIKLDRWLAAQNEYGFSEVYRSRIDKFFTDPSSIRLPSSKKLPDGSPIGNYSCDF